MICLQILIAVMCLILHAKIYAEVSFVLILRKVNELLCLRTTLVDGNLLHPTASVAGFKDPLLTMILCGAKGEFRVI